MFAARGVTLDVLARNLQKYKVLFWLMFQLPEPDESERMSVGFIVKFGILEKRSNNERF
jgi:hypothetical protein